jgi:hypothetical protein
MTPRLVLLLGALVSVPLLMMCSTRATCIGTEPARRAGAPFASPPPLYDVLDSYQMSAAHRTRGESVALMGYKPNDLQYGFATLPLSQQCPLLGSDPVCNQPTMRRCTAWLVAQDRVVTAGHCVTNWHKYGCVANVTVTGMRFLFNHRMVDENHSAPFSAANVYEGKTILECRNTAAEDWAIIRLKRPTTRTPLALEQGGVPADGAIVHYLGHPLGLPLKESSGAVARAYDVGGVFGTSLKSADGASGSPVFDANGSVVGIVDGSDNRPGESNNCRNLSPCAWPNECAPTRVTPVAVFRAAAMQ